MMRRIGGSIREAIDWTQDQLASTRPDAERTLFALLAEGKVAETALGYVLCEDRKDDDETQKMVQQHRHRPRSHAHHAHHARHARHQVHRKRRWRKMEQFKRLNQDQEDIDDTGDVDLTQQDHP